MRALYVIHYPFFGGPQNQALRLAGPLAARGCEITVVLPDEPGDARDRLRGAGIDVIEIPLRRLRALPDPRVQARFALALRRDVRALRRIVSERDIDVVAVHGLVNPQGALAGRLERRGVVWQILDTRPPLAMRAGFFPLVASMADVVMTTGHETARVHPGITRLGDRLIPFYPPVDTTRFRPDPEARRAVRAALGVPQDAPLVGTVGNLTPQKGHEHLIAAAAKLDPEVYVRILGAPFETQPEYARDLERRAADAGLLEGGRLAIGRPQPSVDAVLAAFDVFALTSEPRSEGTPTTVLEAMACGLPVVAADVGGVRELVDDGTTGALVQPRDVDGFAREIGRLVADPARATEMGAAGRRRAVERFDLERCADVHLEAFSQAIARSRRPAGSPRRPARG